MPKDHGYCGQVNSRCCDLAEAMDECCKSIDTTGETADNSGYLRQYTLVGVSTSLMIASTSQGIAMPTLNESAANEVIISSISSAVKPVSSVMVALARSRMMRAAIMLLCPKLECVFCGAQAIGALDVIATAKRRHPLGLDFRVHWHYKYSSIRLAIAAGSSGAMGMRVPCCLPSAHSLML